MTDKQKNKERLRAAAELLEKRIRYKMRFIDAFEKGEVDVDEEIRLLNLIPGVDVEKVVHCRDCLFWNEDEAGTCSVHNKPGIYTTADDYCSYGVRYVRR